MKGGVLLVLVVAGNAAIAAPVDEGDPRHAHQEQESREWFAGDSLLPWFDWSRATGDWGGLRSQIEDAGIAFDIASVFEFSGVAHGGAEQRFDDRFLLDFSTTIDMEQIAGIAGGTAFVQFLSYNGIGGASADAGDIQVYSNLENDRTIATVYEVWWEQVFPAVGLRIKAGKIDANTEFSAVDVAGDFSHSSAGYLPTVHVFPSYPDPAFGVHVLYEPEESPFSIGFAFYDGAAGADGVRTGRRGPKTLFSDELSDDYFFLSEFGAKWEAFDGLLGRAAIGMWVHTGTFARFDGGQDDNAVGVYGLVEQQFFARVLPGGPDDGGLYGFAQFGWADEDVAEITQHYGAGLVLRGLFASRAKDSVGVYCSFAVLSESAGFAADELAVDVYYQAKLTESITVQPELQWIDNPSGVEGDDALVLGLRVFIDW